MSTEQREFLSFAPAEYEARQHALSALMRGRGIDRVLLSGRSNQRWLTGFSALMVASPLRTNVIVIDADGVVTVVVPSDIEGCPNAVADRLELFDETTATRALLDVITRKGGKRRLRVGMELGRGSRLEMAIAEYEEVRKGLEDADVIDIAPVMWEVRGTKSAAEIEKMERANEITSQVLPEAFAELEPGISEHAFAQKMWARMSEMGAGACYLDIHAGPDRHLWANLPNRQTRLLRLDDLVCVDGGAIVDGYYCDIQRMVAFKRPSDEFLRFVEAIGHASRAGVARLAPGVTGAEVYAAGAEEMERRGYGGLLNPQELGHAVGLDIHEVPELGAQSAERVSESAVISIEPYTTHPKLGLYNLENNVLVDAGGVRVLTSMPWGLYCVEEQDWIACV